MRASGLGLAEAGHKQRIKSAHDASAGLELLELREINQSSDLIYSLISISGSVTIDMPRDSRLKYTILYRSD